MKKLYASLLGAFALAAAAQAEPVTYQLDPDHTYPSFETDHFNGASIWRGKFKKTSGTVVLDAKAGKGSIDVAVDMTSIDIGHDELDEHLRSDKFFDVARFPQATFKSQDVTFKNGRPVSARGQFTLHGVTHPLTLTIVSFKCYQNPMLKKEVCGTESTARFDRDAYGVGFGKDYGFKMETVLHIQAEGIRQ
ncbi:polyisoprenoid-binding protein [Bordetella genomosp. 10]|uniref:Polyisoprenoid-binding protein n=1 Tax=Bordetella genomosp. 10 TaxID=1416804 RepID=A0A261SNH9_9BORD|nr:YceI family protein [Bordetella genomosp. 10]OZI38661.1 polyisoprenoid-binding protein [Bordetella genomosp. 10]